MKLHANQFSVNTIKSEAEFPLQDQQRILNKHGIRVPLTHRSDSSQGTDYIANEYIL